MVTMMAGMMMRPLYVVSTGGSDCCSSRFMSQTCQVFITYVTTFCQAAGFWVTGGCCPAWPQHLLCCTSVRPAYFVNFCCITRRV
jgi:hypothetical protein